LYRHHHLAATLSSPLFLGSISAFFFSVFYIKLIFFISNFFYILISKIKYNKYFNIFWNKKTNLKRYQFNNSCRLLTVSMYFQRTTCRVRYEEFNLITTTNKIFFEKILICEHHTYTCVCVWWEIKLVIWDASKSWLEVRIEGRGNKEYSVDQWHAMLKIIQCVECKHALISTNF
jgi:hypothetical protein